MGGRGGVVFCYVERGCSALLLCCWHGMEDWGRVVRGMGTYEDDDVEERVCA